MVRPRAPDALKIAQDMVARQEYLRRRFRGHYFRGPVAQIPRPKVDLGAYHVALGIQRILAGSLFP
jgi:hypothetical protein